MVGLSVMATQMSAVTLVGTTGQAYLTGLRFIQFYFGLPLAMILLSLTLVPFFHRAKVYTAYEYLERRFDVRVRTLAASLFLVGRAMSLGVTLAAPAVVISAILDWSLPTTVLVLNVPMIFYTSLGGVQAVAWTDVKQMFIMVAGIAAAIIVLLAGIPSEVGHRSGAPPGGCDGPAAGARLPLRSARDLHGLVGIHRRPLPDARLLRLRPEPGPALSDGEIGRRGAVVVDDERLREDPAAAGRALHRRPRLHLLRLPDAAHAVQRGARGADRSQSARGRIRARSSGSSAKHSTCASGRPGTGDRAAFLAADERVRDVRARAVAVVKDITGDQQYTDVNYVFPTFITTRMPIGLIGLMIAAIFAAAMSTASGELNSLATATIIDFYRRHFVPSATDAHYLMVSKLATTGWGLFACVVSIYAANQGSLIEVVNRYGSFFYGSLLGVFILAVLTTRATAVGAFWGLIAGMAVVLTVAFTLPIAFLWHNLIGAVVVVVVGLAISAISPARPSRAVT